MPVRKQMINKNRERKWLKFYSSSLACQNYKNHAILWTTPPNNVGRKNHSLQPKYLFQPVLSNCHNSKTFRKSNRIKLCEAKLNLHGHKVCTRFCSSQHISRRFLFISKIIYVKPVKMFISELALNII